MAVVSILKSTTRVDVDEQEVRMDEREVRGKVGDREEGGVKRPHVT
jgi:hypothetical protein